ncbi:sorbosone dehydrogenase family protein [Maribius pontilimi]|uniref:Sorbosone dehydrogenase family protein n=1 Tax=Palleronia pontilimi TaxID=1964209 RepID=A0A934IGG3_9RHOB|nr:sorbosone dehydrogenase family protein [Palleronia pontilimi]
MRFAATIGLVALVACGGPPPAPIETVTGPNPQLPAPRQTLLPTVDIAPARGWPEGRTPVAAPGLAVNAFYQGLDHPRWMHVLPNGDVLVAESNKQPSAPKGLRGLAERIVMGIAGAETPSADRISLLRDADGDGVAEGRTILIDDLTSPFGMALMGNHLFIANTDALVKVPFRPGQTRIESPPEIVARLRANAPNRHWTKGLIARDDRLYVSVGSNSDHAENSLEAEQNRAAIWEIDPATGSARIFGRGLRNPVGMDIEPATGALWTVVNERDELGDNLVPDYLTRVRRGDDYGWPWIYYGDNRDPRVDQAGAPSAAKRPDYALGAHVAPLGLSFADGARLGHGAGAYVGLHGSWNRKPPSGYSVVFVPFRAGQPNGQPRDILTGFLDVGGNALGRPVGVEVARDGALLVADDVGNTIWRVARR